MYKYFVKRNLLKSFKVINEGNYEFVTKQFRDHDVSHWFSGENHPLAGKRTTKESIILWYERLARLMPDLNFVIEKISISGCPSKTVAMLEWSDTLSDPSGKKYSNRGVHVITISWGKVTSLEVFCDTKYLLGYFEALKELGVDEASSDPIED